MCCPLRARWSDRRAGWGFDANARAPDRRISLKTFPDLGLCHWFNFPVNAGGPKMSGPQQEAQGALFYEFSIGDHVPQDHLLRSIDRFVDPGSIRRHLADFYSHTGRPSIDPERLIRMLLVGYYLGIRSERRLCEKVHLNLAYRWFCRPDLTDAVPGHPAFSRNRPYCPANNLALM